MEKVLNPLFESMDVEQETKVALQESFDKAVLVKTTDMMESYVEEKITEKEEILKEEYAEKVTLLESSLDGYLDTVVEEFIQENAPSYEAQIQDEKSKALLEMFDNMLNVVGIDMLTIQEGKDARDDEALQESAEYKVDELTEKVAEMADRVVEAKREADKYLKSGLINELKDGLSMLEGEKFEKIAGLVPFDRTSAYLGNLETLKESIVSSRSAELKEVQGAELPGTAFKSTVVDSKDAMDFSRFV